MIAAHRATGTAVPAGPALTLGLLALDRHRVPVAVAFSALLTTTTPAASGVDTHRYEDTALKSRPRSRCARSLRS